MQELIKGAMERVALSITQTVSEVCCICGRPVEAPKDGIAVLENTANLKCDECRKQAEKDAARKIQYERHDRQERLLSEVPVAFQHTNRAKLPDPSKLDAAMRWKFGPRGLLFLGPTGCGKSRVMWELAKREVLAGKIVGHLSAYELTRYPAMLMQNDDSAQNFVEAFIKCDLLLLDDVFKAKATERIEEMIFAIIDERGSWERPCIVTLNDTGETLQKRLSGDRGPALVRRLREFCSTIQFESQNFRAMKEAL
jgi:DNA replication protein DnaC/primosomal protein DnaI